MKGALTLMNIGVSVHRTALTILVALTATLSVGMVSAGAATPPNGHSPNFAGYQVAVAPTKASTTFKLPALTCTPTNGGIVPGMTFTNFSTNEFSSGGVYVQCFGGQPSYLALAEINDRFSFLTQTLKAGDVMKISVMVSSKSTTVTISDVTARSSVKETVSGPGGGGTFTGFSIGDSAIGSPPLPVSQFAPLTFSGTTINGVSLAASGSHTASDMYSGTTLQVLTGNLNHAGTGFTTTFVHS